jgi:GGDEF domain-containing protein
MPRFADWEGSTYGDDPGVPQLVSVITERDGLARELLNVLPERAFTVLRSVDVEEMVSHLESGHPEAFLVDMHAGADGVTHQIGKIGREPRIDFATPILGIDVVSPPDADRVTMLRSGMWDCLTLPDQGDELGIKLRTLSSAKRVADGFRATSMLNPSTGLYNLRGLIRRLDEAGAAADRAGAPIACVVLGLEDPIDEPPAPDVAASISSAMALALAEVCRVSDVVGQLSRSEFAVIATSTSPSDVPRMIRRIFHELDDRLARPTSDVITPVVAGYSMVPDAHEAGVRPVELLTRAKQALEAARRTGGERMRAYENGDSSPRRPTLSSL